MRKPFNDSKLPAVTKPEWRQAYFREEFEKLGSRSSILKPHPHVSYGYCGDAFGLEYVLPFLKLLSMDATVFKQKPCFVFAILECDPDMRLAKVAASRSASAAVLTMCEFYDMIKPDRDVWDTMVYGICCSSENCEVSVWVPITGGDKMRFKEYIQDSCLYEDRESMMRVMHLIHDVFHWAREGRLQDIKKAI